MVIQRWQSLLLLISVVMGVFFTFLSLGQIQTEDFTLNFTSLGFTYEGEPTDGAPSGTYFGTWYFFVLCLTTTLVTFLDIFLFNNLKLQKKVCLVSALMTIAVIFTGMSLGYNTAGENEMLWSSVICAPFIAVVADVMAFSYMNRDQKRLASADRIR